jgi:hypothetical protein
MDLSNVYIEPAGKKDRQSKLFNFVSSRIVLFLLSLAFSVVVAFLIKKGGVASGGVILAALVAFPTLYGILAYPSFAIVILMTSAYLIMWVIRMNLTGFPLGTVMDAFEALILLTFFWHQRYRPNWSFMRKPTSILILIWLFYCLVLVLNPSAESKLAWVYSYRTMAMAMLMYFAFAYFVTSIGLIRMIIITWLTLSVFAALYAMKQEYIGFAQFELNAIADPLMYTLLFIDGHWRKFSVFGDPVAFSYNMVVSSMLCFSMMWAAPKRWQKIGLAALALLFLRVMLFSGTRGAYVLVPTAFVLYFVLTFHRKMLPLVIIAGVVLVVMIKIPTSNPTLYRFQTAFSPNNDASFNVRKQNQLRVRPYIWSHPFGGGLGAAGASGVRFAPNSYLASFPPDSGYARLAVETGWFGLLVFCTLVFVVLVTGINYFFKIRNRELRGYCLAMVITVFIFNVGNYPQEAIIQFPSNVYFYMAIALIHVIYRIDKQQNAVLTQVESSKNS